MRYTPPKFDNLKDMAFIDVCRLTEDEARTILERIRWPEGPICLHCGSYNNTRIEAKSKTVRDGLIQCNDCRQQFTITVGTVMEGTKITLRQWIQAFHSMCSHKKGVSALQLQRDLGLGSYRSAWHLAHRIREAMKQGPLAQALKGTVEVDETYIGGKSRKGKRGRGSERKTPVVVMIERNGRARSKSVGKVNAATLKAAIRENVDRTSTIMTDEWSAYIGIGKEFAGGHEVIHHGAKEYVRGDVSTNSAESYFALLKRGVHGTFHHISKTHLDRYCDEFSFRWSHRAVTDGKRAEQAVKNMEGKRLQLKNLMGWDG